MALSKMATKLLAWFSLYKITATEYSQKLQQKFPKAKPHGAFKNALDELVLGGY